MAAEGSEHVPSQDASYENLEYSGKRPAEQDADEYDNDNKRRRFVGLEGPSTYLRFLVNSKDAGGVIGKSGSNIKRLREQYKATVNIPDTSCPERILTISTSLGSALAILDELVPKICESALRVNPRDDPEVNMLIHQSHAGTVIGRAGAKIKSFRDATNANIRVCADCLPFSTERVVTIQGSADKIVHAVQLICDEIREVPTKGSVQAYDPSKAHNNYQGGYDGGYNDGGYNDGGYNDGGYNDGGRRGGGRGRGRFGGGGHGGRGGGNNNSGGSSNNFGPGPMDGGNMFSNQMQQPADFPNDGFNNQGSMGQNQGQAYGTTTTQVTIPKDLAGAIIGPGGNRINRIRRDTGATVKIDEAVAGSNDRIITITGSQEQINHSQFLMQKCVREYSGKKF